DSDFLATPNLFDVMMNGTMHHAIGDGEKDGHYYIVDRTNGAFLENISMTNANFPGAADIIAVGGYSYPSGNSSSGNPEIFQPASYTPPGGRAMGLVSAFYPSTSTFAWQKTVRGVVVGSISVVPGAVLFGDKKGTVYALSTNDGHTLWQYK